MNIDVTGSFADGRLVVVLDDVAQRMPPVLVAAAAVVEPMAMAAMIRYTSGFVAVDLPSRRCDELGLPSLVHDPLGRARPIAAVTVDARCGGSTGISAADRSLTARLLADPTSTQGDFTRPGHMVPMRVPDLAGEPADPRDLQIFAAMALCRDAGSVAAVVHSVLIGPDGELMSDDAALRLACDQGWGVLPASVGLDLDARLRVDAA